MKEKKANGNQAFFLENRLKKVNFVSKNVANLSIRNLNHAEIFFYLFCRKDLISFQRATV